MKKNIHPKIYTDCVVTCVCGNTFKTISTVPTIAVDICSNCHPFFTGQQKFVDTEGRIDKFNKKAVQMEEKVKQHKELKAVKKKKQKTPDIKKPTLKELLDEIRKEDAPKSQGEVKSEE